MSIDTEIEGNPVSIEQAATWLRTSLAAELEESANAFNNARKSAVDAWNGTAGVEFGTAMSSGRDAADGLEAAVRSMATDLEEFATSLRSCQNDMSDIRTTARGAGLTCTGFVIADPGTGPARPPDDFTGTPEEVAAHDAKVEAYNAHQQLIGAYNTAATDADRIDRVYATACRNLQEAYTLTEHAAWSVSIGEVLGDGGAAVVAAASKQQSVLRARAFKLESDARAALNDVRNNPDRYKTRNWRRLWLWKSFDPKVYGQALNAAEDAAARAAREADALRLRADSLEPGKLPKFLARGGRILGPLGVGLGVYNDYQEGEPAVQIAVSQGGSLLAGVGAGAATGALIGSVVPGAGTAVGAVVGGVIGAGVSIFTDGAIDSLFENGPDVGAAWNEGVEALADTGGAIVDGISSVGSTIGGWFD